jgi:hypothetical protein
MMLALQTLDGTVVKIVRSKILPQRIVFYFVADTWAVAEQ